MSAPILPSKASLRMSKEIEELRNAPEPVKPSPAAVRTAIALFDVFFITDKYGRFARGVTQVASIIESETHCGEMVEAAHAVEEAYGCECLDSETEPHCPMCNLRAVLAKVNQ